MAFVQIAILGVVRPTVIMASMSFSNCTHSGTAHRVQSLFRLHVVLFNLDIAEIGAFSSFRSESRSLFFQICDCSVRRLGAGVKMPFVYLTGLSFCPQIRFLISSDSFFKLNKSRFSFSSNQTSFCMSCIKALAMSVEKPSSLMAL